MVDPTVLCQKLQIYGVDSLSLEWIKSYLEDRFQAVWIDHILSDWIKVEVGVPQGSILGPLFFVLFANDLPESVELDLEEYAGDSTLTESSKNIDDINTNLSLSLIHI